MWTKLQTNCRHCLLVCNSTCAAGEESFCFPQVNKAKCFRLCSRICGLTHTTYGKSSQSRWSRLNHPREPCVKAKREQFDVKLLTKSLLHSSKGTSRLLLESPKAIITFCHYWAVSVSGFAPTTCPRLKPFTGNKFVGLSLTSSENDSNCVWILLFSGIKVHTLFAFSILFTTKLRLPRATMWEVYTYFTPAVVQTDNYYAFYTNNEEAHEEE